MRGILMAALALMIAQAGSDVTPVTGVSWLHRLGMDYRDTSLGRGAGRYGPGESDPARKADYAFKLDKPIAITGADLYRMNCEACHRAEGTGAPPEIKSVLPLLQGSTLHQMTADVRVRAEQARADLYRRIEKGGQRMPAREYMTRADMDQLFCYLTALAGGGAPKPRSGDGGRTVSVDRVGEFVVKGTCHICHDASGPAPTPEAVLKGAIPPLSTLLANRALTDFVTKVRSGAPTVMGTPPLPHRGRMPVFHYLTPNEIGAACAYLTRHPPI